MIHEFDPVIYPFRLWVSVNPTYEQISEKFYALTEDMGRMDIDKHQFDHDIFSIATTCPVSDKKSGWIGCIVNIWKPNRFTIKELCHESSHVSDYCFEEFGMTTRCFKDGEPYAYFIGWIANCIDSEMNFLINNIDYLQNKLSCPMLGINDFQKELRPTLDFNKIFLG